MSTHTPGPWIMGRGADGLPIIHTAPDSVSPSGQGIAHICKRAMCQDHEANARLIAAAPALLEALEAAVQCMERMPTSWGAAFECDKARAAIAQAKGGTA